MIDTEYMVKKIIRITREIYSLIDEIEAEGIIFPEIGCNYEHNKEKMGNLIIAVRDLNKTIKSNIILNNLEDYRAD